MKRQTTQELETPKRKYVINGQPLNGIIDFRRKNLANWWDFEMLQMRADTGLLHTDPNFNFTLTTDLNITSEVIKMLILMLMLMIYKYADTRRRRKLQILSDFSIVKESMQTTSYTKKNG